MTRRILGQKISHLNTIGSWYANGYINATVDLGKGNKAMTCRIHVSELIKMVNEFTFEVVYKREYYHLVNPELIKDAF